MEKFWDANHEKLPQLQKVVKMLEGVDTSQGGRMIPEDQRPAMCDNFFLALSYIEIHWMNKIVMKDLNVDA
ncbi:unnamed protein product [Brassica oleracea]